MKGRANLLVIVTALAVALGVGAGSLLAVFLPEDKVARGEWLKVIGFPGVILLRLLKMLVVPLVASLMIGALGNVGDIRKAGRLDMRAFFYYVTTTGLAVLIGIVLVNVIRPGEAGSVSSPSGGSGGRLLSKSRFRDIADRAWCLQPKL